MQHFSEQTGRPSPPFQNCIPAPCTAHFLKLSPLPSHASALLQEECAKLNVPPPKLNTPTSTSSARSCSCPAHGLPRHPRGLCSKPLLSTRSLASPTQTALPPALAFFVPLLDTPLTDAFGHCLPACPNWGASLPETGPGSALVQCSARGPRTLPAAWWRLRKHLRAGYTTPFRTDVVLSPDNGRGNSPGGGRGRGMHKDRKTQAGHLQTCRESRLTGLRSPRSTPPEPRNTSARRCSEA